MNEYFFENEICKIKIDSIKYGLLYALIDPEDYEKVKDLHWVMDGRGYVTSQKKENNKRFSYKLHRVVTDCDSKLCVDHIFHDKLDNRKSSLRVCLNKDNIRNQGPQNRKRPQYSKYKGVTWDKARRKWSAKIRVDDKTINLGRTLSEIEAAKAYNEAAIKYFGEFAYLNEI